MTLCFWWVNRLINLENWNFILRSMKCSIDRIVDGFSDDQSTNIQTYIIIVADDGFADIAGDAISPWSGKERREYLATISGRVDW